MNKNICFISDDYPSEGRPVYVFVEQLVNSIVDQGVRVDVVAPQSITRCLFRNVPNLPLKENYTTSSGNAYCVYRPFTISFGNGKRILYKLADFFNQRTISKVLNVLQPNVIYAHFWENAARIAPLAEKNSLPVFVACGEGDNALEELVRGLTKNEQSRLRKLVRGVISVSSENKRKCLQYGLASEKNVIVLPNAVDSSLFFPREKNYSLRHKLGVADDDFLILYIGVFTPRKGASRLAKAIELLQDSKIKVMFIGTKIPGVEDDPICPGIVYKGSVNHNELPNYYASADVFVLPTLKEGCSNAIVESLAMGIPVISSDGPFNDDILDESNSIRINPQDVEALKDAINKMKNEKDLYKQFVDNLQAKDNNYSITTRSQSIISFIESTLQDSITE